MTDDFITQVILGAAAGPYPGDDYDYLVELDGVQYKIHRDKRPRPPNGYPATWVWEQRHGKPWQRILEEIVRRANEAATYAVGF